MSETPFGEESQNRLFIIIAIGLAGLLVLGLMGIGGYVIFSRARRGAEQVAVAQTAAAATAEAQATPTPAEGETPSAGFGGIGAILVGLALAVVLVVVRKVRLAG